MSPLSTESAGSAGDCAEPARKVFGIGLSRTGTTSLTAALQVLGYRARHFPSLRGFPGRLRIQRRELERFDALTDLPAACFYRELDARFPGSRFILTVRDVDSWLESCANYERFRPGFVSKRRIMALRRRVYGTSTFDAGTFRAVYQDHLKGVRAHFRDRQADLLELDVCAGEGWKELCSFLQAPLPTCGFPHKNAASAELTAAQA